MRIIRPAEDIRNDISRNTQLAKVYADARELAEYWRTHFSDSPELVSGWGHNAVCPSCTQPLAYNRESPHAHICTACGTVHDSQDIREAWNATRRHDILNGLHAAALVYDLEGGEEWRMFVLETLGYYADIYDQFMEHGKWVGLAKLMGHTLDEAIWGIKALKALILVQADPLDARAQHIKNKLFVPMARLILSQPTNLVNIALWHAAFATGVGVFFRDVAFLYPLWKPHRVGVKEPFDFTRLCEANGARLLIENITQDGLWRENSISYHYYALSAAMDFYAFLKAADYGEDGTWDVRILPLMRDPQIRDVLARAYLSPLKLLYPNGDLPATSDGWKYSLSSIAGHYVRASFLFADLPEADKQLLAAVVYAAGQPANTMDVLLYGLPENPQLDLFQQESVHFVHNKMAMLRGSKAHVFFKYGNLLAGHSHPDALELSIFPVAVDPGSLSYGAPIHGEYFYVGGSHSTFMIDGQSQYNGACGKATMDDDGLGITGIVENGFPGVTASRTVRIRDTRIDDCMTIDCQQERQMDWLFHGSGSFIAKGKWEDASLPETTHGFKHFHHIKRLADHNGLCVEWMYQGYTLTLTMPPMADVEVFVAETPDNPTSAIRHAIVVRKHGKQLHIPAVFELIKG